MKRARAACVCIAAAVVAAPAAADVTFKKKNDIKVVGTMMSGSSVQFIKGMKMREDQTTGGVQTSTIMDAATRQMVLLNHQKREAEVEKFLGEKHAELARTAGRIHARLDRPVLSGDRDWRSAVRSDGHVELPRIHPSDRSV